jgi:hypothetical protein
MTLFSSAPMKARLAALGIVAGLQVACGDAPSAPRSAPADAPRRAASPGSVTLVTFTYNPAAALDQSLGGGHKIELPAGAVCDPALSSYGAGTWDAPCTPLKAPIDFTVRTWTDAAGRPTAVFSPDVRFVPGTVVTLRLRDKDASIASGSAILWCPTGATTCVNEAAGDASLLTSRDPGDQFVFRRLKHFSGYTVVVDRSGDGSDSGF